MNQLESLSPPLKKTSPNAIASFEEASSSFWREGWSRFCQNKLALTGFFVLVFLIVLAIIGPWLNSYTYYDTHLSLKNSPPSKKFWFGTDELGRDLFTRIWWGARISLFVGMSASFIDLVIGVLYGAIAAMIGGKTEEYMMRTADILYSIPYLLVVILLMVVIGSGISTILIALTFTGWIGMARIMRGQILQLSQMDFIKAAKVLGAGKIRIEDKPRTFAK